MSVDQTRGTSGIRGFGRLRKGAGREQPLQEWAAYRERHPEEGSSGKGGEPHGVDGQRGSR